MSTEQKIGFCIEPVQKIGFLAKDFDEELLHGSKFSPFGWKNSKAELFGFQPCLAYKIFALLDLFSGKDHSKHQYLYKTFQKLAMKNDLEMQEAVVL